MLIHIDHTGVTDALSRNATSRRSHACIENLLLAHFEGNHVISLLPDDAADLQDASPAWSARARRALEHVEDSYAQIAGLRAELPWSLDLGLGAGFDGKAHDAQGGAKIIRASLHAFEKSHTLSCAALLGENATDADLLRELGLLRRTERRWEAVDMMHDARGGGGSTIAPEYERLADKGQIVLAVADTDMRHPSSGEGGTYHKLRLRAANRPEYQRARPLPTRTAEGLVPLDVYKEAFQSLHGHGEQRLGTIERLKKLMGSAPADILRYAHLKSGIRLHQVQNPKTKAEGDYWSEIAKSTGRDRCTQPSAGQCKKDDCKCYVVDGLGANALSDVVEWMRTAAPRDRLPSLFGLSASPDLSSLADEVLAWGLALPPILT